MGEKEISMFHVTSYSSVVTFSLLVYLRMFLPVNDFLAQAENAPVSLSREQKEEFLVSAPILRIRRIPEGFTRPFRATLGKGPLTHDAKIQTIDQFKSIHQMPTGREANFIDSYKHNIAAYRLDKLLDLGMVPVTVGRKVRRKAASVTWWVDDVLMVEKERVRKKIRPPNAQNWNEQLYAVRIFDELIFNMDRNLGNLVITKDWKVWMIDHTRAFRFHKKLRNSKNLVKCDRQLLAALRGLAYESLAKELSAYLNKAQIRALVARRDRIVKFFDRAIEQKGEDAVVYDFK